MNGIWQNRKSEKDAHRIVNEKQEKPWLGSLWKAGDENDHVY